MPKIKSLNLHQAIAAMLKDPALAVRPTHLRDTGVGYVVHNKLLYRHPLSESPAFSFPVTDLLGRWEVVTLERLDFERNNPAEVELEALDKKKTRRKGKRVRSAQPRVKNVGGKRGRPSASEITAAHPGWTSITAAATALGVSYAIVREAVNNGQVPVIYDRGCTLLQLDVLREAEVVKAAHGRTRGRPRKTDAAKVEDDAVSQTEETPAPVADSSSEVYS